MIEIREAQPSDAEAIAAVNAAAWRVAYKGIIEADRLTGIPVKAWIRDIRAGLEDPKPGTFSLVAELDGEFAGSSFVVAPARDGDLGPEVGELVAIYIDPNRWRQGIGRALIEETVRRTAGMGFTELSLWTLTQNEPAIRFYEDLGWRPDGREQIHPSARAPALRMRRPIRAPAAETASEPPAE
jgi:GNAT superfamily N-acetyltransferase